MFRPSSRICPSSGSYTPVTRLKRVVLPAPFGPITRDDLALADRQVELGDDPQAAEGERHALEREQRHQTISTRFSPSRPFGRRTISTTRMIPSTM